MDEDETIVTYVYEKTKNDMTLPDTGHTPKIVLLSIFILSINAIVIKKILKSDKYNGY